MFFMPSDIKPGEGERGWRKVSNKDFVKEGKVCRLDAFRLNDSL
jgi:hypothetical protein